MMQNSPGASINHLPWEHLRPLTKVRVAQVSNRFPTCCIADFQSADRPNLRAREMVRTACRLEALRYSRLETGWKPALRPGPRPWPFAGCALKSEKTERTEKDSKVCRS